MDEVDEVEDRSDAAEDRASDEAMVFLDEAKPEEDDGGDEDEDEEDEDEDKDEDEDEEGEEGEEGEEERWVNLVGGRDRWEVADC